MATELVLATKQFCLWLLYYHLTNPSQAGDAKKRKAPTSSGANKKTRVDEEVGFRSWLAAYYAVVAVRSALHMGIATSRSQLRPKW